MDEPTVAVDPQSRNSILEGIKKLNKNGATIIYTTHYMEEVEQICSRIMIMDKGREIGLRHKGGAERPHPHRGEDNCGGVRAGTGYPGKNPESRGGP